MNDIFILYDFYYVYYHGTVNTRQLELIKWDLMREKEMRKEGRSHEWNGT